MHIYVYCTLYLPDTYALQTSRITIVYNIVILLLLTVIANRRITTTSFIDNNNNIILSNNNKWLYKELIL